MDIQKIDKALEPRPSLGRSLTRKYGVMGLALGADLHARLKNHAESRKLKMGQIIKALLVAYLDEKEGKNAEV